MACWKTKVPNLWTILGLLHKTFKKKKFRLDEESEAWAKCEKTLKKNEKMTSNKGNFTIGRD